MGIKMIYDGFEWNQHKTQPMGFNNDLFTNLEGVKAHCGGGNDLESIGCWLDAYNWSLMKQTPLTEDIYQFISHRAYVVRQGFADEAQRIQEAGGFQWETLWNDVASVLNFIAVHSVEVLNFIIGGLI